MTATEVDWSADVTGKNLSVWQAMMETVSIDLENRPLVGRMADLVALRSAVDTRTGSAVLLAGDAGVGKSRLLAELVESAKADRTVLIGHCLDFAETPPPYLPFADMFARYATESPAEAAELVATYPSIGQLARRTSGGSEGKRLAGDDLRSELHSAIVELATKGPVLVIIEDAHWADRSTRDLVGLLLSRGFDAPVSFVISYRSDDVHRRHPLRAALAEWSRLPGVRRHTLEPLSANDIRTLTRQFAAGPLDANAEEHIIELSGGNAFFAEELVGAEQGSGLWRIPDDLAGLLLVRLDRVDADARRVIQAVAVGGQGARHDHVAAVSGLTDDELDAALRSAVENHLLVPSGADGYAFRHALLAEAVFDDLLPGERKRWHARFVNTLQAVAEQDRRIGYWADLARQARGAGDVDLAITAGISAGREAADLAGADESAQQLRMALDLLTMRPTPPPGVSRIKVVDLLVMAMVAAGDTPQAVSVAKELVSELPADTSDDDRLAAATVLAEAALMEDSMLSLTTATDALELPAAAAPGPLRARLLAVRARAATAHRDQQTAETSAAEALDLAERFGLTRLRADVATTLARLKDRAGRTAESEGDLRRIIDEAAKAQNKTTELRARHHLGGLLLEQAQLARALAEYTTAAARSVELGRPFGAWGLDARLLGGVTAHMLGDWAAAAELLIPPSQPVPDGVAAQLASVQLLLAASRGDQAAMRDIDSVRAYWDFDGMLVIFSGFAGVDLLGQAGDLAAAEALHDEVLEVLRPKWSRFAGEVRLAGVLIARYAGALDQLPAKQWPAVLRRMDELAADVAGIDVGASPGRPFGPEGIAWTFRLRAELAHLHWRAGADTDDAALAASWQRTIDAYEAYGAIFEAAQSRARLAAVLQAAGDDRVAEVAAAATAVAERLGAKPLLAELAAVTCRHRRPRSPAEPGGAAALTDREREVLTLVAAGRTNGEIGKRLFISTKTVSVHVSNILGKLDAGGRTEAAAIARERGLL